MPNTPNQPLISELCSVETSNTDLAHTKVDPYQDPDYEPEVAGEQKPVVPAEAPQPVGQEDSLTDQPRKGVSEEEQMAPASYQLQNASSLDEDTDLDDCMAGDVPLWASHRK